MSCTNLVRTATQNKQALSHARNIAHESGRSRSATGDMPGPSRRGIRPRKHDDAVTPHLDPNKMTSTSIAHYYKSAESFQQIRANIHLNREYKGPSTKPIRPRSTSDSISNGVNKSTGATVSETKPPSRILSSEAWQQTMERRKEREETLKRLTQLIRFHYGDTYDARPFGSTCYGASSSTSDIDVVIIDADRPYGIPAGDKTALPPIYDVRRLAKLLKEEGYKSVSSIPYAAVPLVKLTDPDTGMSCDVNINNRLGVFNTALLRQYCLRAPSLARYLRTIKLWVKSVDLNNPSGEIDKGPRSFSSYAITLMTVAYLQSTGHLPNLQADQDVIVDTHFWEHRLGTRRSVPISFGACKDRRRGAASTGNTADSLNIDAPFRPAW
ncbi:Nucleotidyltransferase [Trametes versicolor FP-101664 SS1]|uniref:Nucleotidyltransferase n=1 Tax=Trametes versicolor (strain FP-101664) TaxID=717944 RepID=UPI0004622590|nr:Nucleotidyltransferase [Trametes versicolor FP-101664 SS1]EIW55746.1 Nucleotidyltransferase [Trametes versicolor FP-101664 SS1]